MALFTSNKSMNAAYMEISRRHPHLNIMVQNNLPRKQLIDNFRRDTHSVLFATRSFFTGVDIKGPSLRILVLDKLPFDNPSDPVTRVLTSRENGFRNYAIPSMVMILKQIIGRGVRSRDDKCVIAFMDLRLKTASYASQIQRTFKATGNYSKRTHSLADVQAFMDTIIQENGLFGTSEAWDPDEIPF